MEWRGHLSSVHETEGDALGEGRRGHFLKLTMGANQATQQETPEGLCDTKLRPSASKQLI